MTPRALKKDNEGFTIIEVMIVLAIAGLIILIVFLAVPALQRNSRNTQRRNDAARISGLISEYVSNNNGSVPPDIASIGNLDLSYYEPSSLALVGSVSSPSTTFTSDSEVIEYHPGVACQDNAPDTNTGNRKYSVAFAVETSSGTDQAQCV